MCTLTERREHLEYFGKVFEDRIDNLVVFKGGMGKKQLAVAQEKLNNLSEGKSNLILATGRYLAKVLITPVLIRFFWPYRFHGKVQLLNMSDGFTGITIAKARL